MVSHSHTCVPCKGHLHIDINAEDSCLLLSKTCAGGCYS